MCVCPPRGRARVDVCTKPMTTLTDNVHTLFFNGDCFTSALQSSFSQCEATIGYDEASHLFSPRRTRGAELISWQQLPPKWQGVTAERDRKMRIQLELERTLTERWKSEMWRWEWGWTWNLKFPLGLEHADAVQVRTLRGSCDLDG